MAALGDVGNHTHNWLSWCDDSYNKCYLAATYNLQNQSFHHYMHGIITEDMVEIPAIMFKKEFMDQSMPVCSYSNYCTTRRSVDIAFRDGRGEVVKVKVKDTVFFIGRGLVMDSFYNPLIVCTGIANTPREAPLIHLKGIRLYCNPSVLSNQNDVMNKYIITHILPYVTKQKIPFYYLWHSNESHRYEVIISDDIYKFFEKPSIDVADDITTQCNEALRNNIEMIKF